MVRRLCADRYGCEEEDVVLAASLDEPWRCCCLDEMSVALADAYGVAIPGEALGGRFATGRRIVVGYIGRPVCKDRSGARPKVRPT